MPQTIPAPSPGILPPLVSGAKPLFRAHMAASHLAIMERHCAAFMARLGDSGTFDLPQEMNALVLGIIMEAFLGADFTRHMPPTVASDFQDFIRGLDPITPRWVPTPHRMRARRARDRMRAAVGELVQARRREPADPPDFVQVLQNYELILVTPRPVPVPTPAFKGPRSPCLIRYRAKPPVNHR